jgi:hypothetical protein
MPYTLKPLVISLKVFETRESPNMGLDECVRVVLFVIASGCGFLNMHRAKVTSRFRFLKKYTEPVCFVKEFMLQDTFISWLIGIVRNHCYGLNPVGFFFF